MRTGVRAAPAAVLRPRPGPWLVSALVLVLLAFVAGTGWQADDSLGRAFEEDGPVELVQVAVLVVAGGLFIAAFTRGLFAVGQACLVLGIAAFIAALRETPRCDSPFYDGGICIEGGLKDGVYGAIALLVLVGLIAKPSIRPRLLAWRENLVVARHLVWTWPSVVAAVLIASGELAEGLGFYRTEEALELAGYAYLAAFATWSFLNVRELSALLVGALEAENGTRR